MNKCIYLLLTFLAIVLQSCDRKIVSVYTEASEFSQYEMNEWTILIKPASITRPYDQDQVKVDLQFTDESGITELLPCFFDPEGTGPYHVWIARFAPKSLGQNTLSVILTLNNEVVETREIGTITVAPSSSHGILHCADNWTFCYDDSTLFRGIGENICWESRDTDDSKFFKELHEDSTRFNYDYMLKQLADHGGNFFRMWMIYWNMPVDWKLPENNHRYTTSEDEFNESALKRMDHVVSLCDSLDIHMMLALDAHGSLLDRGWELSRYNVANGGPASTPAEFFTLPEAKKMYKDKLRLLIARFAYSPSIAIWEFFNEIDNVLYSVEGLSQEIITDWHREMAEYLKDTDPYHHMISTSISHRDIEGMNDIEAMDLNQKHIYCAVPTIPNTIRTYTAKHGKPYVIGEQGYHWDWSMNFNDYEKEFMHDYRHALWLGLFSPTPILPMSWWWEFFEEKDAMRYLLPVRKLSDQMLEAGDGTFSEISCNTTAGSTALAIQAGNNIYAYLHNDTEKGISSDLTLSLADGRYTLSSVNTLNGESKALGEVICQNGTAVLPATKLFAKEDIIYILALAN